MTDNDNKTPTQATFDHFMKEMIENGELDTTNHSPKRRKFLILLRSICFTFMVSTFFGFLPPSPVCLMLAYFGFQTSFLLSD